MIYDKTQPCKRYVPTRLTRTFVILLLCFLVSSSKIPAVAMPEIRRSKNKKNDAQDVSIPFRNHHRRRYKSVRKHDVFSSSNNVSGAINNKLRSVITELLRLLDAYL